jgi:hypothetical protein
MGTRTGHRAGRREDGDEDKQKLSDGLISPRLAVK